MTTIGRSAAVSTAATPGAERAALVLSEAITDLPVPDDVWNEARKHYEEEQLAALVLHASMTNVWNRLNVSVRAVPGEKNW